MLRMNTLLTEMEEQSDGLIIFGIIKFQPSYILLSKSGWTTVYSSA